MGWRIDMDKTSYTYTCLTAHGYQCRVICPVMPAKTFLERLLALHCIPFFNATHVLVSNWPMRSCAGPSEALC